MYMLKLHSFENNKPVTINADNIIYYGYDADRDCTVIITNYIKNNKIAVKEDFKTIDQIFNLGEDDASHK